MAIVQAEGNRPQLRVVPGDLLVGFWLEAVRRLRARSGAAFFAQFGCSPLLAILSAGTRVPMERRELNTARGVAVLETFVDLDRRLRAEGFEPRSPSGEVAAQDEGICVMLACRGCRRAGLAYRPYLTARFGRRSRERYRPVAACDDCGQALEF